MSQYRDEVESERAPGHLAVAFGLTLGVCGWRPEETAAAFLYHTAVGFVSAAMRLSPIGQHEGQRILSEWLPLIERISREVDRNNGDEFLVSHPRYLFDAPWSLWSGGSFDAKIL